MYAFVKRITVCEPVRPDHSAMADRSDNRVIVATQFSRLRERGPGAEAAEIGDLECEAMAALSEAMELLSEALLANASGKNWDDSRHARLDERVRELGRHVARQSEKA